MSNYHQPGGPRRAVGIMRTLLTTSACWSLLGLAGIVVVVLLLPGRETGENNNKKSPGVPPRGTDDVEVDRSSTDSIATRGERTNPPGETDLTAGSPSEGADGSNPQGNIPRFPWQGVTVAASPPPKLDAKSRRSVNHPSEEEQEERLAFLASMTFANGFGMRPPSCPCCR